MADSSFDYIGFPADTARSLARDILSAGERLKELRVFPSDDPNGWTIHVMRDDRQTNGNPVAESHEAGHNDSWLCPGDPRCGNG
jgi:hypothetical protein